MKAVLDTRFFMNSLENRDEQFKKWAKATLRTLQTQANTGIVPSIVIHEFYKLQLEDEAKI
jgi:predicted nucleic acid-binding protein